MTYTKWLNETNLDEVQLVGGKNASLGTMIQNLQSLNINIPNGFVITTLGYDYFLEFNNLKEKIIELMDQLIIEKNLKLIGKQIRNLIQNSSFPNDFINEIQKKYNELSNNYNTINVDVAIRSSGSAEDMPDASFAGQQDTFLNVNGLDDLLKYTKYCFASLFNDRAISYRKSMNYDKFDCKLSVTIQKMVNSGLGSAGVAFSLDINSGFRDIIVINSSYGLGELVVSGNVKPDEFIVSKKALNNNFKSIINKKLGDKNEKIIFDKINGGIKYESVNNEDKIKYSLDEENIEKLSNWVLKIEQLYSKLYGIYCPMDIEWGFDGSELYILQARPETVYSRKDNSKFTQYKTGKIVNKLLLSGIAIGDGIGFGKVKKFNNIDEITNENFLEGDILVTEITDPDWEPIMKKAGAIITNKGGRTCHAAIVARELGVVTVVGTVNATKILEENSELSVVCCNGEVGEIYSGKVVYAKEEVDLNELPSINTKLMMNLASPELAFKVCQLPNSGVGLLREEFIINNYIKVHPLALLHYDKVYHQNVRNEIDSITIGYENKTEYFIDKLTYGLATIATAFYGKDVIVRFSDFKSNEYYNLLGGQYFEPDEENPMIGWRGASRYYSKAYREAFGLECKAIKRVREEYGLKNIIVMLPFVRTVDECKLVLKTMEEFGLKRGDYDLKVYIMCEIPSNVILADEFCKLVDGFSIGSNDLTQLTLGLDRDSELVAHLYNENNLAVRRMLSNVIKTCKENNTKVGICGQGPSDSKEFAEFLVNEGINSMSLTPDSIVKTIINLSKIN
jgi:pyruvate,water dikinase